MDGQDRLAQFRNRRFDIVIVGGGIYGATIACESAGRGLSVALVEQNDFGSGTSANSLKIIHGGLRYLQQLDIRRMRESIVARRHLLHTAPHLVRPLMCVMPTYGHGLQGRTVMRAGLALNDLVSLDRNTGLPHQNRLPRGKVITRKQCLEMVPGVKAEGLTGGALWYDAIALDTERLTLDFILRARQHGCCAANYARADSLTIENGGVAGLAVTDVLSGAAADIAASCIVNAAGPWVTDVFPQHGSALPGDERERVKAVNLIVRKRLFDGYAVGIAGTERFRDRQAMIDKGHRLYFMVPWRGGTMIGTTYSRYDGAPGRPQVSETEIGELLSGINAAYPAAELSREDVTFVHAGLLPGSVDKGKGGVFPQPRKRDRIYGPGNGTGTKGLYAVSGTKYTTACQMAKRVVDRLQSDSAVPKVPPRSAEDSVSGDADANLTAYRDLAQAQRLRERYGGNWERVARLAVEHPGYLSTPDLLVAEVLQAIREEQACTLEDVVVRRTGAGSFERPSRELIQSVAGLMAGELGWDEGRRAAEIDRLEAYYAAMGLGARHR